MTVTRGGIRVGSSTAPDANRSRRTEVRDVVVVGLGIWGAWILHEFAGRGLNVLGVDAFEPPHSFGSSHGQTRVIREACPESVDDTQLVVRSIERYKQIEEGTAQPLLQQTGALYIGRPASQLVRGSVHSLDRFGRPYQDLETAGLRRKFPELRIRDGEVGIIEPQAHVIAAESSWSAVLHAAALRGADIRTNRRVDRVQETSVGGVEVDLGDSVVAADLVVLAVGQWAALIEGVDAELSVEEQCPIWLDDAVARRSWGGDAPILCFAGETDDELLYAIPGLRDEGTKVGLHHGEVGIGASAEESARAALATRWPELAVGPTVFSQVCRYTNTPDYRFSVGPHPQCPGVLVASGDSGRGFKVAPALAERIVRDLLREGES